MASTSKSRCTFVSQRWIFAILASAGLCMQTMFSVILSITIIEMVERTENLEEQDSKSCPSSDNATLNNNTSFVSHIDDKATAGRYSWDEYTQGIILSSFSWSSAIVQFFYGSLAEHFGGKYLLGFAIFAQALLTLMTPFILNWSGWIGLIVTRVTMGLATDGLFSVVTTMIPHWTTPAEETTIANAVYGGSVLGMFFGTVTPAQIIKYSGMGWPAVFYFFGVLGIIWTLLWFTLVYENPKVHPFISDEELRYLQSSSADDKTKSKIPPAPWKHILLCKEFWAFTIGIMGINCALYVMLNSLPRYLGNVIKFPIETNGFFSSVPYVFMWLNSMLSAWISEKVVEKKYMSLTKIRKLFAILSTMGPATLLLMASYAECNKTIVVIAFMIGITLMGSMYSSLAMNPLDLSPNYAGSLMSAEIGINYFIPILAPYLVGVLVPNSTINEWRLVFWIVFAVAVLSSAVYLVGFKAEIQPWNNPNFVRSQAKNYRVKKEVAVEVVSLY